MWRVRQKLRVLRRPHTKHSRLITSSPPLFRRYLKVTHDVSYSSIHPRNVLDIYELTNERNNNDPTTTFHEIVEPPTIATPSEKSQKQNVSILFVHGGMWLRGDKKQPILSPYDVASSFLSETVFPPRRRRQQQQQQQQHQHHPSILPLINTPTESAQDQLSNVGVTTALAGATTYVINYRLAGTEPDSVRHPAQVTDVARALAFVARRELHIHDRNNHRDGKLFVGGHSAGAHLGALALTDTEYLRRALSEGEKRLSTTLPAVASLYGGFFGVSGVYNLSRLAMSPTAGLTVGTAFGEDRGVVLEASPVHALGRCGCGVGGREGRQVSCLLADGEVLLLNATENDFGLEKDSEELLVALDAFGSERGGRRRRRERSVLDGADHLSIMRDFGNGCDGFLPKLRNSGEELNPSSKGDVNDGAFTNRMYSGLSTAYSYAASYLVNEKPDQAALQILKFTGLLNRDRIETKSS